MKYTWIMAACSSEGDTIKINIIKDATVAQAKNKFLKEIKKEKRLCMADGIDYDYGTENIKEIQDVGNKENCFSGYLVFSDFHVTYSLVREDQLREL